MQHKAFLQINANKISLDKFIFLSYIITDTHIWLEPNQACSELTEFTNKKQQSQGFFAAGLLASMRVYLSC